MIKRKVTMKLFWGLRFSRIAGAVSLLGDKNEKIKGVMKFAVNSQKTKKKGIWLFSSCSV
jgi:hypothetical protein